MIVQDMTVQELIDDYDTIVNMMKCCNMLKYSCWCYYFMAILMSDYFDKLTIELDYRLTVLNSEINLIETENMDTVNVFNKLRTIEVQQETITAYEWEEKLKIYNDKIEEQSLLKLEEEL